MNGGSDAADSRTSELVHTRLQLALDAAQMGLWDLDVGTGQLIWDERSAAMFGTTLAKASGTSEDVSLRVHPDDFAPTDELLNQVIDAGGTVDLEFRVIWPDESLHWIHARGQALLGESGLIERLIGTNVDVTEERRAAQERVEDAQRMSGLVAVAQALGETKSEAEVLQVVRGHGMSVLGAQGAGLCLKTADPGRVRLLTTSGHLAEDLRAELADLPADLTLPVVTTALTGTSYFFDDSSGLVAAFPAAEELCRLARIEASAEVPLRMRGELLGALSVAFSRPRRWRSPDRELLEALAALTAQAVARIQAQRAEHEAGVAVRGLSETLQRSLLTAPPEPNVLQIAARYQPAALQAQVGGDWYDSFLTRDGSTTLVVGDVAGHDRDAAAAMAQVRNVLRGVAQMVEGAPADVLSALDDALNGLQVDILTSAVLCRLLPCGRSQPAGSMLLSWSNAGHPPPLLLHPDGSTELLAREPDLLLGLDAATSRASYEVTLRQGTTLLLYSDGLVERRGESLDDGLQRLQDVVRGLQHEPTSRISDVLLERLANDAEDDVALLVLRTPPAGAGRA